jgi:hypothetical protein
MRTSPAPPPSPRPSRAPRARLLTVATVLLAATALTACGGDGDEQAAGPEPAAPAPSGPDRSGPPRGNPVLPDLAPAPPVDVHTQGSESDEWILRFSSVLVNVGKADLLLRARRTEGDWRVFQEIVHSRSGVDPVRRRASLVWGGDGHDHWHVRRVATYRLLRLDDQGEVVPGDEGRVDSKIGFCFFDFGRELDRGPASAVHSRESCGEEDDDEISMGLSPGWGDTYEWALPGQSIDIDGVPDGTYRLQGEADADGLFREVTRDNNVTWVDLELATDGEGRRTALVVEVGPEPR